MGRKLLIGGLASAVLLVGTLVSVSYGGRGGITQPEEIVLTHSICGKDARCGYFRLKPSTKGTGFGQVIQARVPLRDVDGNLVGMSRGHVVTVQGTGSVATVIDTLKDGPHTYRGSVTLTGFVQSGGCYFGDEVCTFAITGGTGAYVNARGQATLERVQRKIRTTLHLIP
ncbi:MAG: hypothetical protein ACRDGK_06850 [Actinomycetota bacterium]